MPKKKECRGSDLNARVPTQQGLFVRKHGTKPYVHDDALLSPAPWTKLGYPCKSRGR
jgi:hypothetical protein